MKLACLLTELWWVLLSVTVLTEEQRACLWLVSLRKLFAMALHWQTDLRQCETCSRCSRRYRNYRFRLNHTPCAVYKKPHSRASILCIEADRLPLLEAVGHHLSGCHQTTSEVVRLRSEAGIECRRTGKVALFLSNLCSVHHIRKSSAILLHQYPTSRSTRYHRRVLCSP